MRLRLQISFIPYLNRLFACAMATFRFIVRVFGDVMNQLIERASGFDW